MEISTVEKMPAQAKRGRKPTPEVEAIVEALKDGKAHSVACTDETRPATERQIRYAALKAGSGVTVVFDGEALFFKGVKKAKRTTKK